MDWKIIGNNISYIGYYGLQLMLPFVIGAALFQHYGLAQWYVSTLEASIGYALVTCISLMFGGLLIKKVG